jgi:protein-tyrosine phosphatase
LDVVVSLLENDEAAQLQLSGEGAAAQSMGIDFISFPIPDRGVPASVPPVLSMIEKIVAALDKGRNVAVHCRQGIGRSGMIAIGALMSVGMGTEEAIRVVSAARGITVPETSEQLHWLQHLPLGHPIVTSR